LKAALADSVLQTVMPPSRHLFEYINYFGLVTTK
jgi:hypothetical protein